ncbi:MAG: tRNA 2-thiouridine(34) synthase MnmA [Bacteroides sp.]|nr:tRNA 2-thiouridine(34) synthase MnmA [Bacteroides sp.]
MQERPTTLLGISGGTDSSVAAMLLQEKGYEVTGVTFRFYEPTGSLEYIEDAKVLADRLGIRHIIYDVRKEFREKIVTYFIAEYMAGRTPVPCVLCNNYFKWPLLAQIADEEGIEKIASGHYVRIEKSENKYFIKAGKDPDKDQSFFLWGLTQNLLCRMEFPLGEMAKPEVRRLAQERGFIKVATKKDSIGVCFCPLDYHSFLDKQVEKGRISPGEFIDEKGTVIGTHPGYPYFTVGQRRGLGINFNRPVFVKEIDPVHNRVMLASLKSLEKQEMWLKDWNITEENRLLDREDIIVKIRYRKQENRCRVTKNENGLLHVKLFEPLTVVAPGQAAAFYKDGIVLGGGIIL